MCQIPLPANCYVHAKWHQIDPKSLESNNLHPYGFKGIRRKEELQIWDVLTPSTLSCWLRNGCYWSSLDDSFELLSVPQKQPTEGGIYAVRLLILMLKKTFKKWQLTSQQMVFGFTYMAVRGKKKKSHLDSVQKTPTTLFCRNVFFYCSHQVFWLLTVFVSVSCRAWPVTVLIPTRPSKWIKSLSCDEWKRWCREDAGHGNTVLDLLKLYTVY